MVGLVSAILGFVANSTKYGWNVGGPAFAFASICFSILLHKSIMNVIKNESIHPISKIPKHSKRKKNLFRILAVTNISLPVISSFFVYWFIFKSSGQVNSHIRFQTAQQKSDKIPFSEFLLRTLDFSSTHSDSTEKPSFTMVVQSETSQQENIAKKDSVIKPPQKKRQKEDNTEKTIDEMDSAGEKYLFNQ